MPRSALFEWEGREYDHNPKSADWYWALGIIAVAVAGLFQRAQHQITENAFLRFTLNLSNKSLIIARRDVEVFPRERNVLADLAAVARPPQSDADHFREERKKLEQRFLR